VTQYFPPEIGAPQTRLSEMARAWAAAGDEVTVLTGLPNHPTGIVPAQYRGRARFDEQVDGYRVIRTWLYATPNERFVRKTVSHLSFAFTTMLLGWRPSGKADVVVVSSPNFFSIWSAWVLAKLKRARLVVEIRDLWPAIFVELGVLTNPWIIAALERIELAAYRAADRVVVVSDGFRDHIAARGIPATKIEVVTNGADLDRFEPRPASVETRERLGAAPDDCLVLYTGAHGISHGLVALADVAAKVVDERVHFAFVGEGAAKRDLARRVAELGLTNVTLLPGVPADAMPGLVAAADICLVPLRDVPLFSTFIPSKMFEYMAAAKAIVGAVRGEPARILRAAGAIVVEPEDVDAITAAIRSLVADPARRLAMGRQARDFARANYDRHVLADRYRTLLAR
jgi:glycosyltransferase involved in cell wall biosynthesis